MSLYEDDFYAWTRHQAVALRRLAAERANVTLDLANLAEELEDLGDSAYAACASDLVRIMHHLLKLEHSPAADPRRGWKASVAEARDELDRRLTATIAKRLAEELPALYAAARERARVDLAEHDEPTDLPAHWPWRWERMRAPGWYPG